MLSQLYPVPSATPWQCDELCLIRLRDPPIHPSFEANSQWTRIWFGLLVPSPVEVLHLRHRRHCQGFTLSSVLFSLLRRSQARRYLTLANKDWFRQISSQIAICKHQRQMSRFEVCCQLPFCFIKDGVQLRNFFIHLRLPTRILMTALLVTAFTE